MGKRDSGPGGAQFEIDERWFSEWFEEGYQKLVEFLASYARFNDWCATHKREGDQCQL